MGNSLKKQKKSNAEITPSDSPSKNPFPVVKLHGPQENITTSYMRFALQFKPVKLQFIPSEAYSSPVMQLQDDVVTGNVETMLRVLDMKFPDPRLSRIRGRGSGEDEMILIVWVVKLQHRSLVWHLERMVRWVEEMLTRGGGERGKGRGRMEVGKFGRRYGMLLEVLVEHAQMEERVVFPVLERAVRGLCKVANEEHARDLPMMNGIKEDIKSVGVLDSGTDIFQEAVSSLAERFKKLQEHCKEHFDKEERELLSLIEATELRKNEQESMLGQCMEVMHGTHTHQFRFFMEGLLPHDAIHYLDLITQSNDKTRVSSMICMLVE